MSYFIDLIYINVSTSIEKYPYERHRNKYTVLITANFLERIFRNVKLETVLSHVFNIFIDCS